MSKDEVDGNGDEGDGGDGSRGYWNEEDDSMCCSVVYSVSSVWSPSSCTGGLGRFPEGTPNV